MWCFVEKCSLQNVLSVQLPFENVWNWMYSPMQSKDKKYHLILTHISFAIFHYNLTSDTSSLIWDHMPIFQWCLKNLFCFLLQERWGAVEVLFYFLFGEPESNNKNVHLSMQVWFWSRANKILLVNILFENMHFIVYFLVMTQGDWNHMSLFWTNSNGILLRA